MENCKKDLLSLQNDKLLIQALTHSSYANTIIHQATNGWSFLGDSILSMVISEFIFKNYQLRANFQRCVQALYVNSPWQNAVLI